MSSLLALCPTNKKALFVPLMDARRNNVYAGFYENAKPVMPEAHLPFERVIELIKGASRKPLSEKLEPLWSRFKNTAKDQFQRNLAKCS